MRRTNLIEAMCRFARAYADQTEADHQALVKAVVSRRTSGRVRRARTRPQPHFGGRPPSSDVAALKQTVYARVFSVVVSLAGLSPREIAGACNDRVQAPDLGDERPHVADHNSPQRKLGASSLRGSTQERVGI